MKHRQAVKFAFSQYKSTFASQGGRDHLSPLGVKPHRELLDLSIYVYV